MWYNLTRAVRAVSSPGAAAAALVVLLQCAAAGCRDSGAGLASRGPATPIQLAFNVGDTLTFDLWEIDPDGYTDPATRTRFVWSVVSVSGVYAGAGGVTTIVQSGLPGFPPVAADTLRFRFQDSGDIYQYGFIAGTIMRREGVGLVPQWDRIGAFSLPRGDIWTVGTTDSAATVLLNASVATEREYYVAQINGVPSVFRGYTVVLSADNLLGEITFSDTPPAVVRMIQEPSGLSKGLLQSLVGVVTHEGVH